MIRGLRSLRRGSLLAVALLVQSLSGAAHPAQFTALQFTVAPSGEFRATMDVDVLAFAVGKTSAEAGNEELEALLAGPRKTLADDLAVASAQFQREVVVQTDVGDAVTVGWHFPGLLEIDSVLARHLAPRILIVGEITFSGVLPRGAQGVSVRLPYVIGQAVHFYAVPGGKEEGQLVASGEYSTMVKFPPLSPILLSRAPTTQREAVSGPVAAIVVLAALLFWVGVRQWQRKGSSAGRGS